MGDEKLSGEEIVRRNLVRFRDELSLTQIEAALLIGISPSMLSKMENGERQASNRQLDKIAVAYGREMPHFFMLEPPPPPQTDRRAVMFRVGDWLDPDIATTLREELAKAEDKARRAQLERVAAAKKKLKPTTKK